MNTDVNPQDMELWERLVQSHLRNPEEFRALVEVFLAPGVDRVPSVKQALRAYGVGQHAAVYLLDRLSTDELLALFDDLVGHASYNQRDIVHFRNAIVRLPRAWVLEHIESVAEPLLVAGDYWEYRRLLELYVLLDRDLTLKLARRALAQSDADIIEAGEDALAWYAEK